MGEFKSEIVSVYTVASFAVAQCQVFLKIADDYLKFYPAPAAPCVIRILGVFDCHLLVVELLDLLVFLFQAFEENCAAHRELSLDDSGSRISGIHEIRAVADLV